MKDFNVFDIIGPIMVGPSSSHTAGAVRLGKIARAIAGNQTPSSAEIYLHGSFAETYKGHGTDLALISGLLGFETDSPDIKKAFEFAEKEDLKFNFFPVDLGPAQHPNTVKFSLIKKDGTKLEIIGKSVGGGNIAITELDGYEISLKGDLPTLFTKHKDIPGIIHQVSGILCDHKINIAFMKVFRKEKRLEAIMVLETDDTISKDIIKQIQNIPSILSTHYLDPV
jgi:L-serine dehydratase